MNRSFLWRSLHIVKSHHFNRISSTSVVLLKYSILLVNIHYRSEKLSKQCKSHECRINEQIITTTARNEEKTERKKSNVSSLGCCSYGMNEFKLKIAFVLCLAFSVLPSVCLFYCHSICAFYFYSFSSFIHRHACMYEALQRL